MLVIALISCALLAFLRPRLALGVLLFLIPFGHLVRFAVAGVPFTFPEAAIFVLAAVLILQRLFALPLKLPLLGGGEKRKWFRDPWVVLPLLWILVAAVSATYSPNALRAWGMWKAYFLAPVALFLVMRAILRRWSTLGEGRQMTNDECRMTNLLQRRIRLWRKFPISNDQNFLRLTSYVLLPIAASVFIVAAIAILQRWWPIGVPYPWSVPGKFRATSVFGYPNAVGLYLAPLVPIFLCMAFRDVGAALRGRPGGDVAPPLRFLCGIAVLASVLAIALARSTGALVALAVVLPVLILLSWHFHTRTPSPPSHLRAPDAHSHDRGNRRLANSLAAGLIGAWVVASLLLTLWLPQQRERPRWGPPIVQKLTFQKWSGSVRLAQYRETWQLLRDHSIRGAGLAGYQTAIAPYHEKQNVEIFLYPHNLLLAVWVELGLAGIFVFLAILYRFFRQLFSPPHDGRGSGRGWGLRTGIAAAMLVILIHGLVDVPYFKNDLAMVFWVIVAIGTIRSAPGTIAVYGGSVATGLYSSTPSDR